MDIKVLYELDETMNQRIIVIRGDKEEKSLNIVANCNKEESYYHGLYLKEYFKHEYLSDSAIQNIRNRIDGNYYATRSIVLYFANKYQNIIFMEMTKDYSNERCGIFFVPSEINQTQYKEIINLMPYFRKFKTILLQDKLTNDSLYDEETQIYENERLSELEEYFKSITKERTK